MARKKTIMKEHILGAAEKIFKKDGIHSLTARNVADELDCSTQPIYNEFKNMEQLRKEVIHSSEVLFTAYLSEEADKTKSLQKVCEAFVEFAETQSAIFKSMYMISHNYTKDLHRNLGEAMVKNMTASLEMTTDSADLWENLYPQLFGLASLVALGVMTTGDIDLSAIVEAYIEDAEKLTAN